MRSLHCNFRRNGIGLLAWCLVLGGGLWLTVPAPAEVGADIQRAAVKLSGASAEAPAVQPAPFASAFAKPGQNTELSDSLTPAALVNTDPEVVKLLGKDPSFIYQAGDRPDPMLIPWTRVRVMSQELAGIADVATKGKNFAVALKAYREILNLLDSIPGSYKSMKALEPIRVKAMDGLLKSESLRSSETGGGGSADGEAKLPAWVQSNLTGIIYSLRDPVCLVGPYTLRVGETVPGQDVPVVVEKVLHDAVQFKVLNKSFVVNIQEGE